MLVIFLLFFQPTGAIDGRSDITHDAGLLPIDLGPAKLQESWHSFTHYYETSPLKKNYNSLSNSYYQLRRNPLTKNSKFSAPFILAKDLLLRSSIKQASLNITAPQTQTIKKEFMTVRSTECGNESSPGGRAAAAAAAGGSGTDVRGNASVTRRRIDDESREEKSFGEKTSGAEETQSEDTSVGSNFTGADSIRRRGASSPSSCYRRTSRDDSAPDVLFGACGSPTEGSLEDNEGLGAENEESQEAREAATQVWMAGFGTIAGKRTFLHDIYQNRFGRSGEELCVRLLAKLRAGTYIAAGHGNHLHICHACDYFNSTCRCYVTKVVRSRFGKWPPTEKAAAEHAFRTYLQVQEWQGEKTDPCILCHHFTILCQMCNQSCDNFQMKDTLQGEEEKGDIDEPEIMTFLDENQDSEPGLSTAVPDEKSETDGEYDESDLKIEEPTTRVLRSSGKRGQDELVEECADASFDTLQFSAGHRTANDQEDYRSEGQGDIRAGGDREESIAGIDIGPIGQRQRQHKGETILNMMMNSAVTPLARFFDSHLWLESTYKWMPTDQKSLRQALKLAQYQISKMSIIKIFNHVNSIDTDKLLFASDTPSELLAAARQQSPESVKSLSDCINPENYAGVRGAAKSITGFDAATYRVATPGTVDRLLALLRDAVSLKREETATASAFSEGSKREVRKQCCHFDDLLSSAWPVDIGRHAQLTTLQRRFSNPPEIPVSADVHASFREATSMVARSTVLLDPFQNLELEQTYARCQISSVV
ncbi:unnamed protein product [Bemisia tabaci]|uniref:Uncharacterized protein n=1 Tax=Bemisia tabaci TaxID=7038 RepID=A0A9P0AL93_BEMTA|nr:unnamed protein product [Bemisia tabaci]